MPGSHCVREGVPEETRGSMNLSCAEQRGPLHPSRWDSRCLRGCSSCKRNSSPPPSQRQPRAPPLDVEKRSRKSTKGRPVQAACRFTRWVTLPGNAHARRIRRQQRRPALPSQRASPGCVSLRRSRRRELAGTAERAERLKKGGRSGVAKRNAGSDGREPAFLCEYRMETPVPRKQYSGVRSRVPAADLLLFFGIVCVCCEVLRKRKGPAHAGPFC